MTPLGGEGKGLALLSLMFVLEESNAIEPPLQPVKETSLPVASERNEAKFARKQNEMRASSLLLLSVNISDLFKRGFPSSFQVQLRTTCGGPRIGGHEQQCLTL